DLAGVDGTDAVREIGRPVLDEAQTRGQRLRSGVGLADTVAQQNGAVGRLMRTCLRQLGAGVELVEAAAELLRAGVRRGVARGDLVETAAQLLRAVVGLLGPDVE